MSTYRFTINESNQVTKIEEFEDGFWKVDDSDTWSYDPANRTVTKTETEKGKTKTETYSVSDSNNDGVFETVPGSSSGNDQSNGSKFFDFTIVGTQVTNVVEIREGKSSETEEIESNETYTYDPNTDTVTRIETYSNYTETTTYVRSGVNEYFVRASESYTLADGSAVTSFGSGLDDDSIYGSDDDDKYSTGKGDDYIESFSGNDDINSGNGDDYIYAGDGDDKVIAGSGDDLIIGGSGKGNDLYNGGSGVDTVKYTSAVSSIQVNLKKGTAEGVEIDADKLVSIENVIGGTGNDTLLGSSAKNNMSGNDGNDIIKGDAGNDNLSGDAGNDALYGGSGKDTLTGGGGSDTFVFDTQLSKSNIDTIVDFESTVDKILLDDAIFKKLKNLDISDRFITDKSEMTDKNGYLVFDNASGTLSYDSNGVSKGGETVVALLGNSAVLVADDVQLF